MILCVHVQLVAQVLKPVLNLNCLKWY